MAARTDGDGAAFAGSQLQTQLWVNRRTAGLDEALREALPVLANASFDWRSPLAADRYAEFGDRAFLRRVDLDEHAAGLKAFWPAGGPHWDALATVSQPDSGRPGVLLVEGKSW